MNFEELIQQVMYLVITGIMPIITVYIVNFLKSKIQENVKKIENDQMEKYINSETEAISIAVISISQTYVDAMKKAGKFDEAAQKEAKRMAIEKAKELITEDARKAIECLYSDFDKYLDSVIESIVRESKIEVKKESEQCANTICIEKCSFEN